MLRIFLAATAILTILGTHAPCAVLHVDLAGGGDFETISEGVAAASAGDTVLVAPGTYMGPLNRGVSGLVDITLTSEGGADVTVIDCEDEDFAFTVGTGGVLDGLTIRRGYGHAVNGNTAVFMMSMTGLATISNCVLMDNIGTGLLTYGNNYVRDCVFGDHGTTCVAVEPGGRTVISNCSFENGVGSGLSLYNEWYGDAHTPHEVLDCVFQRIGGTALGVSYENPIVERCLFVDSGVALWLTSSSALIRDCTIVSNRSPLYGALHFSLGNHSGGQNSCAVENCIVAFNECDGSVSGVPDQSAFDENCLFSNAGGDSLVSGGTGRSNIFEDPLICDLEGGDYTLCENSPCLATNEPTGVTMGAFASAAGCGPCNSPLSGRSWGSIKALYR